jgi:hypothetical protein
MTRNGLSYIAFLILVLPYFFSPAALAETSGSFTVVKGDVQVTSKEGKTEKARIGKKVVPSDIITSGPDSRAKIVMIDKNIINISPDTKLALEKYVFDSASNNKQVTLNVMYGKVRATVEQKYDGDRNKFQIKTPSAVAGVRGTDFLTSYSPKTRETKIVTFEGRVAVGLPGPQGQILNPVMVGSGQMTTASQGAPPTAPAPVPQEEFTKINSDSKNEATNPDSSKSDLNNQPKEDAKDKTDDTASNSAAEPQSDARDQKKEEQATAKPEENKTAEAGKKEEGSQSSKKESLITGENSKKEEPSKQTQAESRRAERGSSAASEANAAAATPGVSPSENANSNASNDKGKGNRGPNPPPNQRAPASVGSNPSAPGTLMLDRSDLAPTVSRDVINPNLQPLPLLNNFTPTNQATQATQQYLNQVNQIIQNGNINTKVNIILKPVSP